MELNSLVENVYSCVLPFDHLVSPLLLKNPNCHSEFGLWIKYSVIFLQLCISNNLKCLSIKQNYPFKLNIWSMSRVHVYYIYVDKQGVQWTVFKYVVNIFCQELQIWNQMCIEWWWYGSPLFPQQQIRLIKLHRDTRESKDNTE